MKDGVGNFLWKISVALYLIANGALGLSKGVTGLGGGDYRYILGLIFKGDILNILVAAVSVISLIAGICIILEMLNVKVSFLNTLILIIAIVWVVYVIIEIYGWITGKYRSESLFYILQRLAVHLMVLSSLLIASNKG